jgi:hypothetical protein
MHTTQAPRSRLIAALTRMAARLRTDERGTSMTEFVICLPVFILIFIGIVNLNKLQQESLAVKMRATNKMWSQAIPVQKSNQAARMLPVAQGIAAGAHIGSHFRYPIADGIGIASAGGLTGFGHFGESWGMTLPVDAMANIGVELAMQGNKVYGTSSDVYYTRDIVDDGIIKSSPSGSGPLGALNSLVSAAGVRAAVGAGIRYGLATGEDKATVTFAGQNFELSAGYDVLVAPKPTAEAITIAVTRLGVESYKPFNGVLGIEWSNKL